MHEQYPALSLHERGEGGDKGAEMRLEASLEMDNQHPQCTRHSANQVVPTRDLTSGTALVFTPPSASASISPTIWLCSQQGFLNSYSRQAEQARVLPLRPQAVLG